MTIGIGALCGSNGPKRPDTIIMASDTLGSYGDVNSTVALHKLFVFTPPILFAVTANDVSKAASLLTKIGTYVGDLPDRSYGWITKAIAGAVTSYRTARFQDERLGDFSLDATGDWKAEAQKLGILKAVLRSYRKTSLDCELLVGSLDRDGVAALFYIGSDGKVFPLAHPGFAAIGTGSDNAMFWLSFRQQEHHMSLQRTAYHVYEAKRMAEQSPHVGKEIELLVAYAGRAFRLNARTPEQSGCPVSLTALEETWRRFGPPDTTPLDKSD